MRAAGSAGSSRRSHQLVHGELLGRGQAVDRGRRIEHGPAGRARAHGVGRDAGAGQIRRQRAHEPDHGVLRRAVGAQAAQPQQPGRRGHGHEPALAGLGRLEERGHGRRRPGGARPFTLTSKSTSHCASAVSHNGGPPLMTPATATAACEAAELARPPRPPRRACPTRCARRRPPCARRRRDARPPPPGPPWRRGIVEAGRRHSGRPPPPASRRPPARRPWRRRCPGRRPVTTAAGLTGADQCAVTTAGQVAHEGVEERPALVGARTRGITQHAVGRYRPHPFGAETGQQPVERLGAPGLGQLEPHGLRVDGQHAARSRSGRRGRPRPAAAGATPARRPPRRRSARCTSDSASSFPPWALTNTTPANEPRAERTISTRRPASTWCRPRACPGTGVLAAGPVGDGGSHRDAAAARRPAPPPRRPRCGCRCRAGGAVRAARASPTARPGRRAAGRLHLGPGGAGEIHALRSRRRRAEADAAVWAPGSASRPGRPWSGRGPSAAGSPSAARAASPWPCTHSGSGPSSGRPVKNLAAMHPPRQASKEPHDAQAPALCGSRSEVKSADSRQTAGKPPGSRTLPARNWRSMTKGQA